MQNLITFNLIKQSETYEHWKSEYIGPHDLKTKDCIERMKKRGYEVNLLRGAHGFYLDAQGNKNKLTNSLIKGE